MTEAWGLDREALHTMKDVSTCLPFEDFEGNTGTIGISADMVGKQTDYCVLLDGSRVYVVALRSFSVVNKLASISMLNELQANEYFDAASVCCRDTSSDVIDLCV
ncbi:uncharacterized [Tachysurus ichikawai]